MKESSCSACGAAVEVAELQEEQCGFGVRIELLLLLLLLLQRFDLLLLYECRRQGRER